MAKLRKVEQREDEMIPDPREDNLPRRMRETLAALRGRVEHAERERDEASRTIQTVASDTNPGTAAVVLIPDLTGEYVEFGFVDGGVWRFRNPRAVDDQDQWLDVQWVGDHLEVEASAAMRLVVRPTRSDLIQLRAEPNDGRA